MRLTPPSVLAVAMRGDQQKPGVALWQQAVRDNAGAARVDEGTLLERHGRKSWRLVCVVLCARDERTQTGNATQHKHTSIHSASAMVQQRERVSHKMGELQEVSDRVVGCEQGPRERKSPNA